MKGISNMNSKYNWYYRLGSDNDNTFLWTGHISSNTRITREQAKQFIRQKERLNRLPSRTIVMSARELVKSKARPVTVSATRPQNQEVATALMLVNKFC